MNTLLNTCKAALAAEKTREDILVSSIALLALVANGAYFFG